MSSRQAQKERLRKERLERERQAAQAAARRRRLLIGGGVAAVVAVVAVVVALAAGGGGGKSSSTSGLLTTPAPWPAVTNGLPARAASLGLPPPSDTIYHIHALLRVFVNGSRVTVPADIGINPATGFIDSLHTHDTSGIIHMESVRPYAFTLEQFFTVWGVKFSDSQLGAYKAGGGKVLAAYVNGKRVADPVNYKIRAHDSIVVGYGRPGSFPTRVRTVFPSGL